MSNFYLYCSYTEFLKTIEESSIYQNSVTHIAEDSASTSGDLTATNSILNENLLQLLSAAANATTTSSSPNSSGVSAAPLQYFMQKLSLNEEQTSQVLSNLGQLSKQQQQPPKVANLGLGFPSAQFKPTLSPTDPIIQADYGSFNNRNAISPTGSIFSFQVLSTTRYKLNNKSTFFKDLSINFCFL